MITSFQFSGQGPREMWDETESVIYTYVTRAIPGQYELIPTKMITYLILQIPSK